jgi:hypothetical protein
MALRSPYAPGSSSALCAVAVGGVADAAERHGEAAFGVGAAPVVGGAADALQLGLAEVTDTPHPRLVTRPFDALDHLADVAHRTAGQGEILDVHHRLVAQFEGVEAGLTGPHLAAGLGAADHGGCPGVGLGLVHEALDGARPGLDVADGVAAGEHHAGDDAVGDGGLAAGGEDDGLVAAQREVAEGVASAVLGEQRPQPGLVVLGEAGGRVLGPEGEVDGGDRGQPAERAEGEGDGPGGVALVVDRALEAEQAVDHVGEAVGQARVADHPVRVDADDDQAQHDGSGAHEDEVRQGPPAAARVGQGRELVAVQDQRCEQRGGDQHPDDGVAVHELRHRADRQQDDGGAPGAALAALEAVGEQQQQDSVGQRDRRGERPERSGQHLGDRVHTAVPEPREHPRGDVQDPHEGGRSADEHRTGLGTRAAQHAPHPA